MTMTAAVPRKAPANLLAQLPPFPAIAARLILLVTAPQVSFRDVADLVRSDAAFSARVLRLANSPLLGGREVSSILHALSILGSERLNALVMTVGVHHLMSRDAASGVQRRCWRHSLATACITEMLAPRFDVIPDVAYTAGLLHDIGCIALARARTDEYEELLRSVHSAEAQLAAESDLYGVDHCRLGAQLVAHWGLPKQFAALMVEHHSSVPASGPLTRLTRLADLLADHIGFSLLDAPAPEEFPDWIAADLENGSLLATISDRINRLECSLL